MNTTKQDWIELIQAVLHVAAAGQGMEGRKLRVSYKDGVFSSTVDPKDG